MKRVGCKPYAEFVPKRANFRVFTPENNMGFSTPGNCNNVNSVVVSNPVGIAIDQSTGNIPLRGQTALSYIADYEQEEYSPILDSLQPYFAQFVAGMGELVFNSQNETRRNYYLLNPEQDGSISRFPVIFVEDLNGNWKISYF